MLAEKTIRKHVAMIHAYSLMSSLQRKIVNVFLYEASQHKNILNSRKSVVVECRIPFSNLCKEINFNSNNTHYLKEAIDELASLKIEWNLLKDKVPSDISFLNLRVLHGPPTFFQDNTLNFSFHRIMLDLIDNPCVYGTVDLQLQSQFESKYSHSLYENSTRFVNLHKDQPIQLSTFRKLLGVPENKYKSMREFKRNVILPSIEEVNDRAHFVVSLNNIKVGRKISGFAFSVTNKKFSKPHDPTRDPINNAREKIGNEIKSLFGMIKETIIENVLKRYEEEYILEKIRYTKEHAKKEPTGFYPIRYFISALKNDYKAKEHGQASTDTDTDTKKSNGKTELWEQEFYKLQDDFNHWKKMFDFAKAAGHRSHIKMTQKLVEQSQKKLEQHCLKQPKRNKIKKKSILANHELDSS